MCSFFHPHRFCFLFFEPFFVCLSRLCLSSCQYIWLQLDSKIKFVNVISGLKPLQYHSRFCSINPVEGEKKGKVDSKFICSWRMKNYNDGIGVCLSFFFFNFPFTGVLFLPPCTSTNHWTFCKILYDYFGYIPKTYWLDKRPKWWADQMRKKWKMREKWRS